MYDGSFTQKVKAQFRKFVPNATAQFLNDQVNERLTTALVGASFTPDVPDAPIDPLDIGAVAHAEQREASIIATPDELEGYGIVKAFVCSAVKPARITARDQQSYFAILLDDNSRKTIARLWFNQKKQKYIGTFDEAKAKTRHPISSIDDPYQFPDLNRAAVKHQLSGKASGDKVMTCTSQSARRIFVQVVVSVSELGTSASEPEVTDDHPEFTGSASRYVFTPSPTAKEAPADDS